MIPLLITCLMMIGAVAAGYNVFSGLRSMDDPEAAEENLDKSNAAFLIMLVAGGAGAVLVLLLL